VDIDKSAVAPPGRKSTSPPAKITPPAHFHLSPIRHHNAMEATIEFSPAIPIPISVDVQKRIQELRGYLDPNNPHYQPEQQHTNIKAAIKLYEDGKIDGVEQVYIKNGKVVPKKEIFKGGSWSWNEGIWHQFTQKHAYGQGP
jgi:hypothetical protein